MTYAADGLMFCPGFNTMFEFATIDFLTNISLFTTILPGGEIPAVSNSGNPKF